VIDHFTLPVAELDASRRFYEHVLAPLGYRRIAVDGAAMGFGRDTWSFGIVAANPPIRPLHLAFEAATRKAVDEFYAAALEAGGRTNGGPGLRTSYDPDYYCVRPRPGWPQHRSSLPACALIGGASRSFAV
jgi:catechol 2,3-dioxygenase-like lactoylglutathione lyase family enzyme